MYPNTTAKSAMRYLALILTSTLTLACAEGGTDSGPEPAAAPAAKAVAEAPAARPKAGKFRVVVDQALTNSDGQVVASGIVLSGKASVGDTLCVNRKNVAGRPVTVEGLESAGKAIEMATVGQRVEMQLSGVSDGDVKFADEVSSEC